MAKKKKGLVAFLKRTFNGRKWNEVRTRKKMLFFSIALVLVYTIISFIMLWLNKYLDSTLTSEYFGFAKWLVASGVAITLCEKVSDITKNFTSSYEAEDEVIITECAETNEELE